MSPALYLFLFFTVFISHGDVTKAVAEPVCDITGQPLRTGVRYYILPVIRGRGGGLTMTRIKNTNCPNSVIQDQSEVSKGLPLTFSPSEKSRIINLSTDLNFKFSDSSIWNLDNFDEATQQWFITTCGVEGNPGRETVGNWFKIEKLEDDYKLLFCPGVCNFCKVMCREIGVFVQGYNRRLVLSNAPLKIMFKRA